jgi:hypothetical protein
LGHARSPRQNRPGADPSREANPPPGGTHRARNRYRKPRLNRPETETDPDRRCRNRGIPHRELDPTGSEEIVLDLGVNLVHRTAGDRANLPARLAFP